MINNQINQENTNLALLNAAILEAQNLLTSFSNSDQILANFTTAFGDKYDRDTALSLIAQWQTSNFSSFPEFEILSSATINGANGAYSIDTNKIYISEEYLLANANDIQAIADVVLEEYAHYIDAQINVIDADGDEGDIFAGLVQGKSFTEDQLQQLKAENDHGVVTIDGEEISIEQVRMKGDGTSETIQGTNVDDVISGRGGNDTIHGHFGDDGIYGNDGNDYLYGDSSNDRLYGQNGDDSLSAGYDYDFLDGGASNDILDGGAGNDTLDAGEGNDTLDGGNNNDFLDGGAGNDTVDYSNFNNSIRVNLNLTTLYGIQGSRTFVLNEGWQDTLESIEAVIGTIYNDSLIGSSDNNTLNGNNGYDRLHGEAGNDYIIGGNGSDYIDGGDGIDTASYASATVGIDVDLGTTAVHQDGYGYGETLVNIENVDGSGYNDTIIGSGDNNYLSGNNGADQLFGQEGDDSLHEISEVYPTTTSLEASTLTGGSGADTFVINIVGETNSTVEFNTQKFNDFIDYLYSFSTPTDLERYKSFYDLGTGILSASGIAGPLVDTVAAIGGEAFDQAIFDEQVRLAEGFFEFKDVEWITQTNYFRQSVTIRDFQIGVDTILLPSLKGEEVTIPSPNEEPKFGVKSRGLL